MGSTATSYSGMLFYDHNSVVGNFQGFNNSTKEYRINNVAAVGSINFMVGSTSRFLVANSGNIGISQPASHLQARRPAWEFYWHPPEVHWQFLGRGHRRIQW